MQNRRKSGWNEFPPGGVAWLSLRDRVRSLDIRRELGVEPLLLHVRVSWRGLGMWSGCLLGASSWRCSGHVPLIGGSGANPEHVGGITYLIWPGKALESPRRSWKALLGRWTSGVLWLAYCPCDSAPNMDGWIDGWMDGWMDEAGNNMTASTSRAVHFWTYKMYRAIKFQPWYQFAAS